MATTIERGGWIVDVTYDDLPAAEAAAITRRRLVRYKLRLAFLWLLLGLGAAGLTLLGLRWEYAYALAFWLGVCRHIVAWGPNLSLLRARADAEFAKVLHELRARNRAVDPSLNGQPDKPSDIEAVEAIIRTYRIEDTGGWFHGRLGWLLDRRGPDAN